MDRFYISPNTLTQSSISLPDPVARHVQVLRKQPGDIIELFDGQGSISQAIITNMSKKHVTVELIQTTELLIESPLHSTLLQSISSSERMDFTIQKSVELGISIIQPILTERSTQRPTGEKAHRKLERWQDIAIRACEQCRRTILPQINPITSFQDAISSSNPDSLKLLMSINPSGHLRDFPKPSHLTFLIGPEGGLNSEEEKAAQISGFHSVSLGPRVLRTETASLALLSAAQLLWGDF